jgi:hypothetical protein
MLKPMLQANANANASLELCDCCVCGVLSLFAVMIFFNIIIIMLDVTD